jgi:3-oxoacyl-[acyl-carrier protein] reductase
MTGRRAALVTGASRGIGRAVAGRLVEDGFDVTISARSEDDLAVVAQKLSGRGPEVAVSAADMSVEEQILALADAHVARFGRLDALVIGAGVGMGGPLETFPLRRLDVQFGVNVRGPLTLVQRLLPILRATALHSPETGCRIIAVASITGVVSAEGLAAYGLTKAALISLCESITLEEGAHGVNATAISPGYVDTSMSEWVHDDIDPSTMIRPSDVAELAAALCRLSRYAAVPNVVITRPGKQLWRP